MTNMQTSIFDLEEPGEELVLSIKPKDPTKVFRPMKPPSGVLEDEDLSLVRFPVLGSPKIDGIRMMCQNAKLVSSTLKDIPNKFVREAFSTPEFEGLDGEGCVGSLTYGNCFSRSTSLLMSDENLIEEPVSWNIFDKYIYPDAEYWERANQAAKQVVSLEREIAPNIYIRLVLQKMILNLDDLLAYEKECIAAGYEGAMFRNPKAFYKQGRSTMSVQELMRRKPFSDAEAIVIGFEEGETNTNPQTTNALGLAKRSSSKAGKIKNGTLGNYLVKGLTAFKDVEFSITAFGTEKENEERWLNKESLIGKIIKYKYQKYGSIDKPRIATGIGFRSELDITL